MASIRALSQIVKFFFGYTLLFFAQYIIQILSCGTYRFGNCQFLCMYVVFDESKYDQVNCFASTCVAPKHWAFFCSRRSSNELKEFPGGPTHLPTLLNFRKNFINITRKLGGGSKHFFKSIAVDE